MASAQHIFDSTSHKICNGMAEGRIKHSRRLELDNDPYHMINRKHSNEDIMSLAVLQTEPSNALVPINEPRRVLTIVKAIVRTADAWKLTNAEAAALFDVPLATWSRMKAGAYRGTLDQDKVTRASLMIGIFKGLRLLFNGPLAYGWPKLANKGPQFMARSPVDYMITGGIPAIMSVRQHIDALRGGL